MTFDLARAYAPSSFARAQLTRLLQDSLGAGNAKVLMIVTVSPLLCDANETCASLAFAARCRAVALGTARVALPPPPQSPSASSGAAAAQSPGGADGAGDETRDRASAARQMRSRSLVARPGVKG